MCPCFIHLAGMGNYAQNIRRLGAMEYHMGLVQMDNGLSGVSLGFLCEGAFCAWGWVSLADLGVSVA